jgi:hypothetical protein
MKNPRRLPGILDVTYQTLPEREECVSHYFLIGNVLSSFKRNGSFQKAANAYSACHISIEPLAISYLNR